MRDRIFREYTKTKPLSEALMDLATRVKKFEESSTVTTAQQESKEIEKSAVELREAAQNWWSDTREALEHQIGVMRTDFDKWQAELKERRTAQADGKTETIEPASKS